MRRTGRYSTIFAAACLALYAACAVAGESPELQLQLNSTDIYIGESVDLYVTEKNVKTPVVPDLTALSADFDYRLLTEQPRSQVSTTIINGRMSQNSSYTYIFRLTPKRPGTLEIPSLKVEADGTKLIGNALQMRVQAAERQDLVIAEVLVSRTRVFPTQPFDVTLKVLVKPLPVEATRDPLAPLQRQNPAIEVNWVDVPDGLSSDDTRSWLQKYITETGVGFTVNGLTVHGFLEQHYAVFSLQTGRERRTGLDGTQIDYFVYELKRTFKPERPGKYTFGPAAVKGHFVDALSGRRFSTKRLVVSADPKTVEVAEVPSPRPATFCGGIGAYDLTASATPTNLRVGDPLTLNLEIKRKPGSGSLDLVKAPDLSANAALAADFDIVDKAPTGESKGDAKKFSYALRPRRAGATLPAIAVTFFDPDTEKFTDASTAPIALTVTQAAQLRPGELVGALPTNNSQEIKSRQEGIFQNITDFRELQNQQVNTVLAIAIAMGSWAAFALMSLLVTNYRRKSSDAVWQRRQRARRGAEEHLAKARSAASGSKSDALRAIRAALVELIADMLNVPAAGMTAHEARQLLKARGVSAERCDETVRLLETIEAAEYGSADAENISALIENAAGLIPKLHRELEALK
ncbi:MAG TPA: BatD family protein [Planctomycetota bacterium]|nr:BatD family protein [Planctomycetota bacterium]